MISTVACLSLFKKKKVAQQIISITVFGKKKIVLSKESKGVTFCRVMVYSFFKLGLSLRASFEDFACYTIVAVV